MELMLGFFKEPKRLLPSHRPEFDRTVIVALPLAVNGPPHGVDLVIPKALSESLRTEHRANNHRQDG